MEYSTQLIMMNYLGEHELKMPKSDMKKFDWGENVKRRFVVGKVFKKYKDAKM